MRPSCRDAGEEPAKDILEPTALVLENQSILAENVPSTPLYQMNWSVTSVSQKGSSIIFERVEHHVPENVGSTTPTKPQNKHIFYLAHPVNAQYRTDIPAAYYVTSVSREMLGNITLEISKSQFQKPEFKALLSAKKTASDNPLFNEKAQQKPLFNVKRTWKGGGYKWFNSDGGEVAFEDGKDGQDKLVVVVSMQREMRDALVAMWALRLWHDTAESRQAKREGIY